MSDVARFEAHLSRCERTPTGCWLWPLSLDTGGYGQVAFGGRVRRAHRVAAHLFLGMDLDSGLHVCHRCDVRRCVNPDHLFLGTNADNMRDRNEKGHVPVGSAASAAKLTEPEVIAARAMAEYGVRHSRIARRLGVARETIGRVARRESWQHITADDETAALFDNYLERQR